ncbi:MAG: OmpH family outer membrane protein [Fluviicola sp.]
MNKWILGFAVLGLLASCGSDEDSESKEKDQAKESKEKSIRIAYYELEKMYTELEFSINAGKELEKEMMAANEEYAKYSKQYESNLKIMQNPNATLEEQMKADSRYQQAQRKLMEIQQASGYQMKQMELEQQLGAYLFKYSKEYAKEIGVDFMFMNAPGGVIAYGNEAYNVTDEFIKYLNQKIGSEMQQPTDPNAQGQPIQGQPTSGQEPASVPAQ